MSMKWKSFWSSRATRTMYYMDTYLPTIFFNPVLSSDCFWEAYFRSLQRRTLSVSSWANMSRACSPVCLQQKKHSICCTGRVYGQLKYNCIYNSVLILIMSTPRSFASTCLQNGASFSCLEHDSHANHIMVRSCSTSSFHALRWFCSRNSRVSFSHRWIFSGDTKSIATLMQSLKLRT